MARWKIVTYLDDTCQEHATLEECQARPEYWDEEEYGEWDPENDSFCYHPAPKGEIDTRDEAWNWTRDLLTYGDKHQDACFVDTTIEAVN